MKFKVLLLLLTHCIGTMPSIVSYSLRRSMAVVLLCLLISLNVVDGVCPHCQDNLPSCTWATTNSCPTITVVATNVLVLAGRATLGITLSLTGLIRPRFLRVFDRSSLEAMVALFNRPAPGSTFTMDFDTPLSTIMQAIATGLFSLEMTFMRFAELQDATTDDDELAKIKRNVNMLSAAKDVQAFTIGGHANTIDAGWLVFLYAKISAFVSKAGLVTKVTLGGIATGLVASASIVNPTSQTVFSATVVRPTSWFEFMEALNLMAMYLTALGFTTMVIWGDFVEHVIFDTIRMRHRGWEFSHELMLIMFRRIEDSAGKLNLGNSFDECHLNTLMEEADRHVTHFYPGAATSDHDIFRADGGNPGALSGGKAKAWNNKFTPTSTRGCNAFNSGRDHVALDLLPNGTCRYNHVCDHWVSNKGPGGRCLGEAGTTGHLRVACDNPNACEEKQQ